ncbi:hypothetical protein BDR26DRAFT_788684, partial [Obelidium mucronatum]
HDNLLFKAILIFGFIALHRLGELVDSNDPAEAHYNRSHRILLSSIYYNDPNHPSFLSYHLPYHKGDPNSAGCPSYISDKPDWKDCNPLPILMAYLTSRIRLPTSLPLFMTSACNVPTRKWFMQRLQAYLHSNIGSKSLRGGGATDLALRGTPAKTIQ